MADNVLRIKLKKKESVCVIYFSGNLCLQVLYFFFHFELFHYTRISKYEHGKINGQGIRLFLWLGSGNTVCMLYLNGWKCELHRYPKKFYLVFVCVWMQARSKNVDPWIRKNRHICDIQWNVSIALLSQKKFVRV